MTDINWIGIAEKVGIAIVIFIVTWIVAKVVKWLIGKVVSRISFLQKSGDDGQSPGESIGSIGSLIVWLFGLIAILQVFSLQNALAPIQDLLSTLMSYLPNVIGAGVVFFIGFVIAKIAKQLIASAIGMVNIGGITGKMQKAESAATGSAGSSAGQHAVAEGESGAGGPAEQPGGGMDAQRIGSIVGSVVFAIILILVGIAALQILDIAVISDPAKHMLTMILNAIPMIIAALLLLGIGYLIARLIASVLESTLRGLGTDRAERNLGILGADKSASTILTRTAQVAIMVFFGMMAARSLQFTTITNVLNTVFLLGGRILFGGVIVGVGVLIAKIVANLISDRTTSSIVRYGTIALFAAMGLKYMGIANSIIILAFGSAVIGGALAVALAFGIGGRHAAARMLAKKQDQAEAESREENG